MYNYNAKIPIIIQIWSLTIKVILQSSSDKYFSEKNMHGRLLLIYVEPVYKCHLPRKASFTVPSDGLYRQV